MRPLRQKKHLQKTLIIGTGWAGKTIFRALHEYAEQQYELVGFVVDNPQDIGKEIEITYNDSRDRLNKPKKLPVLASTENYTEIISEQRITTIVWALTNQLSGELYQYLADSLVHKVNIVPMPELYEQLTGKVPVGCSHDHWWVPMPIKHVSPRVIPAFLKRVFDIFWACVGLVFLIIVFPIIAAAIYLDSPGPIFYVQERLGLFGKPFKLYKFRSMIPDAEKGKPIWAEENDPRVTKVGRFLRKTHIDEFPQFLNVLKGEMSVVGPRPERLELVEEVVRDIPFFRARHVVKPGMAGWGLIHHGYGDSVDDALVKLQYDLYYIKHQSLWLDMVIIVQTCWKTLTFQGR